MRASRGGSGSEASDVSGRFGDGDSHGAFSFSTVSGSCTNHRIET
jgi:hypothetical protein